MVRATVTVETTVASHTPLAVFTLTDRDLLALAYLVLRVLSRAVKPPLQVVVPSQASLAVLQDLLVITVIMTEKASTVDFPVGLFLLASLPLPLFLSVVESLLISLFSLAAFLRLVASPAAASLAVVSLLLPAASLEVSLKAALLSPRTLTSPHFPAV